MSFPLICRTIITAQMCVKKEWDMNNDLLPLHNAFLVLPPHLDHHQAWDRSHHLVTWLEVLLTPSQTTTDKTCILSLTSIPKSLSVKSNHFYCPLEVYNIKQTGTGWTKHQTFMKLPRLCRQKRAFFTNKQTSNKTLVLLADWALHESNENRDCLNAWINLTQKQRQATYQEAESVKQNPEELKKAKQIPQIKIQKELWAKSVKF